MTVYAGPIVVAPDGTSLTESAGSTRGVTTVMTAVARVASQRGNAIVADVAEAYCRPYTAQAYGLALLVGASARLV